MLVIFLQIFALTTILQTLCQPNQFLRLTEFGEASGWISAEEIQEFEDYIYPAGLSFPVNYKGMFEGCLLYTSPSPRDATLSRMPSSA